MKVNSMHTCLLVLQLKCIVLKKLLKSILSSYLHMNPFYISIFVNCTHNLELKRKQFENLNL